MSKNRFNQQSPPIENGLTFIFYIFSLKIKKIPQVCERAKIFYLLYFLYKTSNKIYEIMGKNKSNKNIYVQT